MTLLNLLPMLREAPLVASVQATEGSPLDSTERLLPLAAASLQQGVKVLRAQGGDTIRALRGVTIGPIVGLVKRAYADSPVYIGATGRELDELLKTDCEIIALDATRRVRPNGELLTDLVDRAHSEGRLVLGDCDDIDAVRYAIASGCDLVSTTLAGYTEKAPPTAGPDLEFLRQAVKESSVPVLAEGRFATPQQVQAAMRIGATAVVVGGALNDPVKQTRSLLEASLPRQGLVGAVDIGGTWIRFGVFSEDMKLLRSEREPLPREREERQEWILSRVEEHGIERLGVSTGGTVHPATGIVIEAKPIIPDHEGSRFSMREFGVPTSALNDGLATAWGHACHPRFAGLRVATLALGTGVGCGFVAGHQLWMGRNGEYSRLNDLAPLADRTFEDLLGGASLTDTPTEEQMDAARYASIRAVRAVHGMYMPDVVVLCGGVGLCDWLDLESNDSVVKSPYGADAGLYGAAALALFPPA